MMLDAGFGPLSTLKARLLPMAAAGELDWDEKLKGLGLAVARRFNRHCAREFQRAVDIEDVFDAAARAWVLTRYPVEEVTCVEVQDLHGRKLVEGWDVDTRAGLLETPSLAGPRGTKLVVTFTGGYWLDPGDGSGMPEGAEELPEDILDAWVLQCQVSAEARGLFAEAAIRPSASEEKPTAGIRLADEVVETLRPYRRFGAG